METVRFIKKLISIPSYVGRDCNEKKIADFLVDYLKKLSWMQIIKQQVNGDRYNIILKDKYPTRFLVVGHMDTVMPRSGWNTNQFNPVVVGDKLFGLGATDMKGNLGAFITALEKFKKTKGLMVLLYIDEEYDFLGMKKFTREFNNKINPQFILSLDGKELEICNGCRGLIEFSCIVKGKTGHASRPQEGLNAIDKSTKAIRCLQEYLEKIYSSKDLGKTTCNLAYLQGGLDLGKDSKGDMKIGKEGNNIADIAEFVLDIRPASLKVNADKIIRKLRRFLENESINLISFKVRHDFFPWITPKNKLSEIEKIVEKNGKLRYSKIGNFGFIDAQFLWRAFNETPTFILGAGEAGCTHSVNEYVSINKLLKVKNTYTNLIKAKGRGGTI